MMDADNFEYDAMEPIDNDNTHSSPYLNHLVIPIKQMVRPSPPPMIFQTPLTVKKIIWTPLFVPSTASN